MKIFKKVLCVLIVFILFSVIFGYLYFDRKFSPDKNYLTVSNESGNIKIRWLDENKNALLIPIKFKDDTITYYMQFDTGSPSTVFYRNSITNNPKIQMNGDKGKASFTIGNTLIESQKFKILDYGKSSKVNKIIIIGTLGTDILENRKTIINFKDNYIAFNLQTTPKDFRSIIFHFKFKKRRIIIPGVLQGKEQNFLYDSGTSAYELLTNKENWTNLKLPNSKIVIEKGNSWGNILTTFTALSNNNIFFAKGQVPLNHVTYVEGLSKTQYYSMKFSGMSGMLGNKIFLNNVIFLDCKNEKIGIK